MKFNINLPLIRTRTVAFLRAADRVMDRAIPLMRAVSITVIGALGAAYSTTMVRLPDAALLKMAIEDAKMTPRPVPSALSERDLFIFLLVFMVGMAMVGVGLVYHWFNPPRR
ncbi:MAG TPA: hypothetical protein VNF29_02445 [Candidatus Binataceae bacterium]|nr:hypothetical protein [Candidatus Binataceae bacterium]